MNPFANMKAPDLDGHTFEEWERDGYKVMRGEKATGRNADGKPTFNSRQVIDAGNFDDDAGDAMEQWMRTENFHRGR